MNDNVVTKLKEIIKKGNLYFNHSLRNATTIKIGGQAKAFVQTSDIDELQALVSLCNTHKVKHIFLGGGSNLLFDDNGFDGIVIKLTPTEMQLAREEGKVLVTLGAGYNIHLASVKLMEESISGFEYVYGLPGLVGGALYMNSKWPKADFEIGDIVREVTFLNEDGTIRVYKKNELEFSYGHSVFQHLKGVIISGVFECHLGDGEEIKKKSDEVMEYRKKSQPTGVFTAGCIFKNISEEEQKLKNLPYTSAGYLIDKAGLKNVKVGDLAVSSIHANFFVNGGKATSQDFRDLVELVKSKVKVEFGVELKEEVLIVT